MKTDIRLLIDQTDFEEWWYLFGQSVAGKETCLDPSEHAKNVAESFLKFIQWKQGGLTNDIEN